MDELDKLTKIENNQTLQIENLLKYISTLDFILYALIFLIILYFLIYIVRNIKLKFSKNYLILRNQITKMDKTSKILVIGILTILISLSLGYIFGEKEYFISTIKFANGSRISEFQYNKLIKTNENEVFTKFKFNYLIFNASLLVIPSISILFFKNSKFK